MQACGSDVWSNWERKDILKIAENIGGSYASTLSERSALTIGLWSKRANGRLSRIRVPKRANRYRRHVHSRTFKSKAAPRGARAHPEDKQTDLKKREYFKMTNILSYFTTSEWTALSVILSGVTLLINSGALIITVIYVATTQKQLNFAVKSYERTEHSSRDKIKNDTLIDLVRTWNSRDYIIARNLANRTLREMGFSPAEVYKKLNAASGTGRESTWIDISMMAHFLARLSALIENDDIDLKKAQTEFSSTVDHWAPILIPIFRSFGDEDRISTLIERSHRALNPSKTVSSYPYFASNNN